MTKTNRIGTIALSLMLTVAYGYLVVFLFDETSGFLETFSWSFVLLVPYAIGALGNVILMRKRDLGLAGAILFPWLYCVGVYIVATIFTVGLLLCFVMGVPILFPAASAGGLTVWLLKRYPQTTKMLLLLALVSPMAVSTVEAQFKTPLTTTTTHTYIDIEADVETIWGKITAVSPVTAAEQSPNLFHMLGLPRPVEATLTQAGVGGVRKARWENGLQFDEAITDWTENEYIAFTIVNTSDELLPMPMAMIDGEQFGLVRGEYRLEPLNDTTVRLHFTSEHYLSTNFNKYGAWWTNQMMTSLQDYILEIMKARAEGDW